MDIMAALRSTVEAIKTWVNENKVQKVSGKGLSSNDYTAEDKEKVNNIANGLLIKDNELYLSKDGNPIYDGVSLPTNSVAEEAIQSDWNQNNEEAADYIKNKPFYTDDLVETELVDINAILVENNDGWSKYSEETVDGTNYLWIVFSNFVLEEGKQYSVVINDNKYIAIAALENMGNDAICLGDFEGYKTFIGSGDASDFTYLVIYEPTYGEIGIMCKGVNAPTECKIYSIDQEVVKIDPKYLPEGGVGYVETTSETIHKIDKKFLPEHIQSDWNENNPGSEGYVANRTHWVETNKDTIIEEVEQTSAGGYGKAWKWDTDIEQPNFVVGETYVVMVGDYNYNSTEHACICFEYTDDYNEKSIVLGNPGIISGEDGTGEPFYIYNHDENDYGIVTNSDVLSIAVYHVDEEVRKLDKKFLPDDISNLATLVGDISVSEQINEVLLNNQTDYNQNDSTAPDYIKNRPFYSEIIEEEVELIPEQTFRNSDGGQYQLSDALTFVDDKTYIVTLNGQRYECTAYVDSSVVKISAEFEKNGYKWSFECQSYADGIVFFFSNYVDDYTIKIVCTEQVERVSKIDSKYLPDGFSGSWNDLTDKPFGGETVYYEWNEETEYTEVFPVEDFMAEQYAKISDDAPGSDFFVGKYIQVIRGGEKLAGQITEDSIYPVSDLTYAIMDIYIVASGEDTAAELGVTLTKGIWVPDNYREDIPFTPDVVRIIDPEAPIDEKYIPDTIARVSQIPDCPLKTPASYEWSADEEYAEEVPYDTVKLVKISDDTPEYSSFLGGTLITHTLEDGVEQTNTFELHESSGFIAQGDGYWNVGELFIIVTAESVDVGAESPLTRGVWVLESGSIVYCKIVGAVKTLDEIYIPDTIARTSDVIAISTTAKVDQTIIVKAVDENGKPVEWEAANVPIIPSHIYEWHSDTEYSDRVTTSDPNVSFVKISDEVISSSFLINGTFTMLIPESEEYGKASQEIGELDIEQYDGYYQLYKVVVFVTADTASLIFIDDSQVTLSKGIWIVDLSVEGVTDVYVSTYGKPVDEFIIPDTIARADHTHSWNDLEDRPFGEESSGGTIEWDGNTEGRDSITFNGFTLYKVSDSVFSESDCIGATAEASTGKSFVVTEEDITVGAGCFSIREILVVKETECSLIGMTFSAPSIGCYFGIEDGIYASKFTYGSVTVNQLDEKFIPDTIARKSDIITIPVSASVGQTIVVKAVDENGKPTEWECVDIPALPSVTAEDNGKVLTVVDGAWALV